MRMLSPSVNVQAHTAVAPIVYWEITFKAFAPHRATLEAADLDLHTLKQYVLKQRDIVLIETGIGVQIPVGHFGLIAPRSGLALKGIQVLAGVIDSDYQGEIKIILLNSGDLGLTVQPGD
ncbi:uncharacterized protein LOC144769555 [Lissotriton helveticus]